MSTQYQVVIDIKGDKELNLALTRIAQNLERGKAQALDAAADRVAQNMKWLAPKWSGELAESIGNVKSDATANTRTIRPMGQTGSSSHATPRYYAYYAEEGAAPMSPKIPNVSDIARRFRVDTRSAWAIAKALSHRSQHAYKYAYMTYVRAGEIFKDTVMRMVVFAARV